MTTEREDPISLTTIMKVHKVSQYVVEIDGNRYEPELCRITAIEPNYDRHIVGIKTEGWGTHYVYIPTDEFVKKVIPFIGVNDMNEIVPSKTPIYKLYKYGTQFRMNGFIRGFMHINLLDVDMEWEKRKDIPKYILFDGLND